ncbi:MAG TPA: hypothetical protein PLQ93_11590 [Bacteroidia bacterium]|nr:hypothetical protein [Bacteroidia bacterium]
MKKEENETGPDPRDLFDKKKYNTLLIGREGFTTGEQDLSDELEVLFEANLSRERAEAIFDLIKIKGNAAFLVSVIRAMSSDEHKAILCAACWESGLDFSTEFLFFTELVCAEHYRLAMEALTVLQSSENIPPVAMRDSCVSLLRSSKHHHTELVEEALSFFSGLSENTDG